MSTHYNNPKSQLRTILETHFNISELQTLCQDLDVVYDQLGGSTLSDKSRELIDFLDRRQRLPELVAVGKVLRPDIDWPPVNEYRWQKEKKASSTESRNSKKSRFGLGVMIISTPKELPSGSSDEVDNAGSNPTLEIGSVEVNTDESMTDTNEEIAEENHDQGSEEIAEEGADIVDDNVDDDAVTDIADDNVDDDAVPDFYDDTDEIDL